MARLRVTSDDIGITKGPCGRSATLNWKRSEVEQGVRLLQPRGDEDSESALALLQHTAFSFSMRVCGQRQDAEYTVQEVYSSQVRIYQIR